MKKPSKRTEKAPSSAARSARQVGAQGEKPATGAGVAGSPSPAGELDSREQSAWFDRAVSYFGARDFRKAREFFERASAGPRLDIAHTARVHIRMCEQRIEKTPVALKSADDFYNYAITLINRRDLESAEQYLEKAALLASSADHVYYALALCCGLRGDLARARDHLRRAIDLQPRNRAQARNDPDFAELAHHSSIRELLFPEGR